MIDAAFPGHGLNVYDYMYEVWHVCNEMTKTNCLIFSQ